MLGNGPLQGFRVHPRSIVNIRSTADNVRQVLQIGGNITQLEMGRFLDELSCNFSIIYDVLETHEMPHRGVEACCIPENLEICIREDVYEHACRNEPRARFTIIHEFGHLILGHRRTVNREEGATLQTFEDSEWQANQFAAEFLMPLELINKQGLSNSGELERFFNVSGIAADKRVRQLTKRGEM
ncbi:MAG: ImmA/IrrE family metallo-endopeptidase [Sideroxyarcus sp.]